MLAREKLDGISLKLLDASENLKVSGWVRGTRCNNQGQRCLLGAIDAVTSIFMTKENPSIFMTKENRAMVGRLVKAINLQPEQYGCDHYNFVRIRISENSNPASIVAYWNNMICKDEDEAVAKLKEAAYLPV